MKCALLSILLVQVIQMFPWAGDIPEEDVISNNLEQKLLKLIKVLKVKNLINCNLKFFFQEVKMNAFLQP